MLRDAWRFIRDVKRFYLICVRRAFRGKFWRVEKWTGGFALLGATTTTLASFSERWEQMIGTIPVYFFLAVFLATIAVHFIVAPYLMYSEERARADALQKRQEPKMRVSASYVSESDGATSQTMTGRRVTALTSSYDVIVIYCTNDGMETLRSSICKLIGVWKEASGVWQRLHITEAVQISWSINASAPLFATDIDPGETKTAYIAQVYPQGYAWVLRNPRDLPAKYQQLLGESGNYELLLQFKSDLPDPLQVLVGLKLAEGERVPNNIPRAKADVSIFEKDSPRLLRRDIAEETPR